MISIITRGYNRLEYTIQVVNNVRRTADLDYEHIIIDNNSNDGTHEWFSWIKLNTGWYDKLKYVRLSRNVGDWKGMVEGLEYATGDYVVQLDNDILTEDKWLSSMLYVLNNTSYQIVMLHRNGQEWKLKSQGQQTTLNNGLTICRVERPVACFMMKKDLFEQATKYVRNNNTSKYELARMAHGLVAKIMNVNCWEIDTPFQREKYNPRNPFIWAKL